LGQLTTEKPSQKLKYLSLLPHVVEKKGKDVPLTASAIDPGIYDGSEKFKIDNNLQNCLKSVMANKTFRHIKVALVDLTRDMMQPKYAASFDHQEQVFVASVAKIAAMLAAFQLRHDIWALRSQKPALTLPELFELLQKNMVDTQLDPGGKATPFTRGIALRGKLVLVKGDKVMLGALKVPRLTHVFADSPAAKIKFRSTGEDKAQLESLVKAFNKAYQALSHANANLKKAKGDAAREAAAIKIVTVKLSKFNQEKAKIDALGFWERMGIMVGGDVPTSNYATSTIVRDVGFHYIASTLLQSGLYDTNRNGGLWLGADYWGTRWRVPPGGGVMQSATAGSLATFMTLLAQQQLVSPIACVGMRSLMQKVPHLVNPGTGSWFQNGLRQLQNSGSLKTVLAKVGLGAGGADDFAFIEREINLNGGKKLLLRYVAVGLRAKNGDELEQLIRELDKCVLANNGFTPAQGGHP
jgi:hypothetical protein